MNSSLPETMGASCFHVRPRTRPSMRRQCYVLHTSTAHVITFERQRLM